MIFVGGVHGVGKSYICNVINQHTGLTLYSASSIISKYKKNEFSKDKKISDIDKNQDILVKAFQMINDSNCILDGHFCLLNEAGQITKIPLSTFKNLFPQKVVLLYDNPISIAERLYKRDGISHDISIIETFQKQELEYCAEVVETLDIPYYIHNCTSDICDLIYFIKTT